MTGNRIAVLAAVCLLALNAGFLTAAAPSVKVSSPASGSVSASRMVNITGTASGSDGKWFQGSRSDFDAGVKEGTVLDPGGNLTLDNGIYDDFNDNSFDTSRWTKMLETGGAVISETGGRLRIACRNTASSYWLCRGDIRSTGPVSWSLAADLVTFSGSGSGYATALTMYQDDSNMVSIGHTYDPGSWGAGVKVLFGGWSGGAMFQQSLKDAASGQHNYRLAYSAGTIFVYEDGQLLVSKAISLSNCRISIYDAARWYGDTLTAEWDNVKADFAKSGMFTSGVFDTLSADPVLKRVNWNATAPSGTAVKVEVRSCDTEDMVSPTDWQSVTSGQSTGLPAVLRYLQYRVSPMSSDGAATPVFKNITLAYNKPVAKVEVSIDGQAGWMEATGTTSWSATLNLPENSTVVWVRVTDVAGDTDITSMTIEVDTTRPAGTVVINSNDPFTTGRDVILTLNATDRYGVQSMMISELSNLGDGSWEDYSPATTWKLSSGDGIKTVHVKYRDRNGWESKVCSDTILLDTAAPSGSMLIDGGAEFTRNTTVRLALNATDPSGLDGMMVSNSPEFSGAQWIDYQEDLSWALVPGSAERTVHVKFRDRGAHVSQVLSDTIIEDLDPPAVGLVVNGGAPYTSTRNVTVDLSPVENNRVAAMQLGELSGEFPPARPWVPFAANGTLTLSPGEGSKTVKARLLDAAGNIGFVNSSAIIYDSTAPATRLGSLPASSPRAKVPVEWNATDITSGVLWYDVQYRAGEGSWKEWLTHTSHTNAVFSGEDLETYQFRARAQDRAGNLEEFPETVDNSLTIQLPEPVVTFVKPKEKATLSGKAAFNGTCQPVTDGRNVTRVEWCVDNGTWQAADGLLSWGFRLDTTRLSDGKHTVLVRTFDGTHYSTEVGRQITVKNARPKGFLGADGFLLVLVAGAAAIAALGRRRGRQKD